MTDTMSEAAGEFKFIIVEQDRFTKYVHFLCLLKRHKPKRPFCFVGHAYCFRTSSVPQSGNGR